MMLLNKILATWLIDIYISLSALPDNSKKLMIKVEESYSHTKQKQVGEETTKHGNKRGQKVLEYEK